MENFIINSLKLASYQQVIHILSQNLDLSAKIPKFQAGLDQLYSNQKKLADLHSLLVKDTSSEKMKDSLRTDLIQKTLPVLTIMQIFAYDKQKKKLLKQIENLSKEYLTCCSDIQLIKTSRKIWEVANKFGGFSLAYLGKSALKPNKSKYNRKLEKQYGLQPAMIKNLEEANIRFIESLLHYESDQKTNDKNVKQIKKLYGQTENLLKNKIDRFVSLVEIESPEFYNEYRKARTDLLQNEGKAQEANEELAMGEKESIKKNKERKPAKGRKLRTPQQTRLAKTVEA